MVAGSLRAVTVVDVSGSRVILTLASAVTSSRDVVTVSYTVPTTNAVRDAEGTEVGALTNQDRDQHHGGADADHGGGGRGRR